MLPPLPGSPARTSWTLIRNLLRSLSATQRGIAGGTSVVKSAVVIGHQLRADGGWKRLKPPGVFEDSVEYERGQDHQCQGERVTERPRELRHDLEVHPVDTRYQGGCEQDGGPGTDLLYLVVLVYANQGEVHAQYVREQLVEGFDLLC